VRSTFGAGAASDPGDAEYSPSTRRARNLAEMPTPLSRTVKQLTELHGGSVHAYSESLGLGAAFVVSLPLAVAACLTGTVA
jgi:hypothetical protein